MRYFITGFAAIVCLVIATAGFQDSLTRNRPIEIFRDMDDQARVRPQSANLFDEILGTGDGRGSRLPVAGTISRGATIDNSPVNTGRAEGSEDWVDLNPLEVSAATLKRGQGRYEIYCTPCHGKAGDGNGIVTQYSLTTADLHQHRLVQLPDGYLFDVISNGFNATTNEVGIAYSRMPGYKTKISKEDRWAIVSYIRALQYSQLGKLDEVDKDDRAELQKIIEGQ
ncbi:MAG: cytochrome c class I [Verrucomicrobiales bacterium]|nr:cytochrome c class I [Verrucomicrobiales bacterium]